MSSTQTDDDLVLSWTLEQADKARNSPSAFINFAATDEHRPNVFVGCAPHLEVLVDFVQAHPKCAVIMPAGGGKSWAMAWLTLYFLGQNPISRGAIVSATEGQAQKPFRLVKDAIAYNPRVRMVFPSLMRSRREGDKWDDTRIVIERPPEIRDASLQAYGLDSAQALGSRISWMICDDLLNGENTNSSEQREKVYQTLRNTYQSRLDPAHGDIPEGRLVLCNTAWHYDDAVQRIHRGLPEHGIPPWPTLRMEITGDIWVYATDWDHRLLRPAHPSSPPEQCRLISHDPDPKNDLPLWPERFDTKAIQKLRENNDPVS